MKIHIVALAALLAANAPAFAQDAGITEGDLAALDTSGEGVLTMDEFKAFAAAAFAKMDGNADGSLSSEEALVVITPTNLAAADTNADGRISKAEFDAEMSKDFTAADKDGNGTLD